jgi:hypothetical protein
MEGQRTDLGPLNRGAHKKNPDLCERPFCRNRWMATVAAWPKDGFHFGHAPWRLNLCVEHAAEYQDAIDVARTVNRTEREPQ